MLLVNDPGSWGAIYPPLEHAAWHGWTPTDLIFPFFLFTGVLEKRIRRTIDAFARDQRDTEVLYAHYLDVHPLLLNVFRERLQEALYGSRNMVNDAKAVCPS